MKTNTIIQRLLAFLAAFIMVQSLFFKFSAAPESVYIFTKIGMEPFGRVGIGIGELIASVLILIPRTNYLGALLAMGLMAGAIFFHLFYLGIVVMNDSGQLFIYALIAFVSSAIIVVFNRKKLLSIIGFRNEK
jgi:hypothetical protein